ncbi:hypothetical protein ACIO8F_40345 [Streptomyces sp. NPDC087228]|uniref:ATP-dependent DNA ligase n=1 Tax=unclassified Streptomyces TaxID=2593676 RepID=UPI0037F15241
MDDGREAAELPAADAQVGDVADDFAAAQSRAASSVTRARALAARYPASYVCWDVLQHPDLQIGDCRRRPYTKRRAFLLELLADAGPPVQVTPATDDRDVAVLWYDALREQGIEGIVCKRGGAGYPLSGQRRWLKVRHADTVDALVLGFTGPGSDRTTARPGPATRSRSALQIY